MISITSVKVEPNPHNYEPEMHFEGVLKLATAFDKTLTDDECALIIGREFMKHAVFVREITKD